MAITKFLINQFVFMKKHLFLFFAVAVAALVGCNDDNTPTPNSASSSKRLVKITENHGSQDIVFNLNYDASGRLITFKDPKNTQTTTITYDVNGNLTKFESKEFGVSIIFEVTYKNGVPETGYLKTFNGSDFTELLTLNYKVEGGLVTKIVQKLQGIEYATSVITYQGGNVSKIVTSSSLVPELNSNIIYTYGTHKNRFITEGFKYILDPLGLSTQFFAKNEITKMVYDYEGEDLDIEINSMYTFDQDGYPLTATESGIGTELITSRFEYNK